MNTQADTNPSIDRDLLATDAFGNSAYQAAALAVANRIRSHLGLPEADRMLSGYRGDTRWGNPVVFTIGAGAPQLVAHFEIDTNRIVVDSLQDEKTFRLVHGSVVEHFIRRFDAGEYPELEA